MSTRSRVWLYGSPFPARPPAAVRDDHARIWTHEQGDFYRMVHRRHHAQWAELTTLSDLVEVGDVRGSYQPPIHTCAAPGCDTPTDGVFCLPCATR